MRFLNEATIFKVFLDGGGLMLSVTTKRNAYFVFLSPSFVGGKVTPTTDPDLGIVEIFDYDIPSIVRNWDRMHLARLPRTPENIARYLGGRRRSTT